MHNNENNGSGQEEQTAENGEGIIEQRDSGQDKAANDAATVEAYRSIIEDLRIELKSRDERIDKLIDQSQRLANSHGNYTQPGVEKPRQPVATGDYKTLSELDYTM